MSVILVFSLLLLTSVLAQDKKYYDKTYNYFEIDYFINNPRLLRKYLECFLDQGPCTPIGRVFKLQRNTLTYNCALLRSRSTVFIFGHTEVLPDVIMTACKKCTPLQKNLSKKAFNAFKTMLPEMHAELKKKYDPQNKYYDAFEKAIASF